MVSTMSDETPEYAEQKTSSSHLYIILMCIYIYNVTLLYNEVWECLLILTLFMYNIYIFIYVYVYMCVCVYSK